MKDVGVDGPETLEDLRGVHNACLRGLPQKTYIHLCRGNGPNSTHYGSGPYEPIAHTLLTTLDYSTFYLKFDIAGAGNFEPLRFLPKEEHIVLSLVTTKSPAMEDLGQACSSGLRSG